MCFFLIHDFYIIGEPGYIIICGKGWREVPNNDWGRGHSFLWTQI